MNDDDVPQLRLNPAYKRLLTKDTNEKLFGGQNSVGKTVRMDGIDYYGFEDVNISTGSGASSRPVTACSTSVRGLGASRSSSPGSARR